MLNWRSLLYVIRGNSPKGELQGFGGGLDHRMGDSVWWYFSRLMWSNSYIYIYLHTHPFNGPLFGTTQVSWYQKRITNLDFIEARDSESQWFQLGRMQVCTWLLTDNHAITPPLSFYRPDAQPTCQSTKGLFIYLLQMKCQQIPWNDLCSSNNAAVTAITVAPCHVQWQCFWCLA